MSAMSVSCSSSCSSSKGRSETERPFDHEKLDVYQLELPFVEWVTDLLEEVRGHAGTKVREVCDHLDRASLSFLFNTAEGNGRRPSRLRGRFFDDARGSATECAAALDALVAKRACEEGRIKAGKDMLFRIASMLSKLVLRFAPDGVVREEAAEYVTGGGVGGTEHENEHEYEAE